MTSDKGKLRTQDPLHVRQDYGFMCEGNCICYLVVTCSACIWCTYELVYRAFAILLPFLGNK